MKGAVLVIVSLAALSGCANDAGARMGLFSATAPVVAILVDDLYMGYAKGYLDRTGTIDIQSTSREDVRCIGEFHYTGSKSGSGQVRCNDGSAADFQFNALSRLSGYGFGRSSLGLFSFTFGLTPEDSRQYLKPPAGKRVEVTTDDKARLIET